MKQTEITTQFYKDRQYRAVEIFESQFRNIYHDSSHFQSFIDERRPSFFQNHKSSVTEKQIIDAVQCEQLFWMVEVDIQVSDKWSPSFQKKMKLSPKEYYSEMSPLFCTTEVPFESIGSHMQDHVKAFGLSEKPRKLLVGGMKGKKMLNATPLLKWYLDHGMEIIKIYQVVEYTSQRCFEKFVSQISNARREGDIDQDKAIIADLNKLIGNSSYGSLIMSQLKQ